MTTNSIHTSAADRRRAQIRSAAARRRAGRRQINIDLDPELFEFLCQLREQQSGPTTDFFRRALVTGAKFLANAGNVRGGKTRIKSSQETSL